MRLDRRTSLLALLALTLGACASAPPQVPNSVLVAGASGQTGQLVVARLVAEGYTVRALVRDAARSGVSFPAGVAVVEGDVKDPATLAPAMAGMTYVISAIGARSALGPDRPEMIDYQGVSNLATAARAAGIRQFVLVSARSVTQPDHPLNKAFGNVLQWKLRGEDALRASGVPYSVVRPGGLVKGEAGAQTIVLAQGDTVTVDTTISRADVAELCVQALKHPDTLNKTFEVSTVPGAPVSDWRALFATLR
jgi:uncharacterized protein YbjT (DUF2867 family)